jgi:hypothetical protein
LTTFNLSTPTIRVPGLLSDEALQEQLKQYKQNFNGGATQAPSSAVEMSNKVQSEFFDAPVRNTLALASGIAPAPVAPALNLLSSVSPGAVAAADPQQRAVDVRSDILSNEAGGLSSYLLGGPLGYLARDGGALDELGTLSPDEAAEEKAQREKDAAHYETALKGSMDARQKLRNLTSEEAAAMGFPIQPGIDAQTEKEQRQELEQADAARVARAEEATKDAKVQTPTKAWWLDALRSFYRGQNSMYTGIGKGAAIGLWELPGELAGIRDEGRSDVRAWFDTVDETMKKVMPPDLARSEDFVTQLSQGAGSMLGFMVAGFLGNQIGLPSNVATMVVGGTSGASQQYEDAERFNAGGLQRFISFMAGAGLGMTEAVPINRALMRLENATGGAVTRGLQATASASLEEFIQELGQNLGQDVVAQAIYDEQRKLDWGSYLKAGAVGGILGALGGGAAQTLQASGVIDVAPTEQQQAKPGEADAGQADFLTTFMNDAQVAFDELTADQPMGQRAPNLQDMLGEARARLQDRRAAAQQIAAEGKPVRMFNGDRSALIGPDVSKPGGYRVTYFDENGPSNHVEHPTLEAAAEAAMREGFAPQKAAAPKPDAGPLLERAKTEQRPGTQVADDFVAGLQRPPLFDYQTTTGKGGTVPAPNENGKIVLRHFSNEERQTLDPNQMGTGPLIGQERARLFGDSAVPRTYFGVRSGPDYVPPNRTSKEYQQLDEAERAEVKRLGKIGVTPKMVQGALDARYRQEAQAAGYQNEGLGSIRHEVEVDPDQLYNMQEDPLNLRAQLPTDAPMTERISAYEKAVKDAGFLGAYFPSSVLGQTAILFEETTPSTVINEAYGLPTSEIASPADFKTPTPESFSKGGWAVLTATQEALGDFKAEANRAADEKLRKVLEKEKIPYIVVEGAYQGEPQGANYMIFAPEERAKKLGKQFKQESILTRDGLIYTDGSNQIVPGRGVTVGPEATQQDFYSQMPDGTAWTMDLDFDGQTTVDMLGQTRQGRNAFNAEQQRDAAGVAGQPTDAGNDIGLTQISQNFNKLLDLTVRMGRFTLKGVEGQFSSKSGVVRLKSPNDLSTLVHEGGHTLEVNATGPLRTFVDNNKTIMQTIARKLYGGDVEGMSVKERVSEGFAEFFRVYTLNRNFAQINYPQLVQDFDAFLAANDPKLATGLQLIGDQFAAWLQLPSSQLLRNMIVSGKETTGINATLAEVKKEGLGNWFREVANRVFTASINRNNQLNRLVADLLNVAQENRGAPLDLKRANDPRVLIRMATNAGNRAMVQLTDGIMPHRSTDPTTPGLRTVLLRYHGIKADGTLKAIDPIRQKDFAAYVVALRGIDEYARYSQGIIERPPLAATLGDLQVAVTEAEAKYGDDFKEAARMIHDYGMGLWEKSYAAGLLDEDTYNDGLSRGFYVPLQRDLSDKDISQSGISAAAVGQGRSVVKRFRGSDRDIIDPMDALMEKTFSLEKVIAENEVKKALAQLADKAGQVGALVERVPAHRLMGQQFSVQEVARALTKDPTVSATDAADMMAILETAIDEGNRIALFRSQQAQAAGENMVFFWEKGKLAAIQIKDGDVGADIINVLNAVGTETVPLLVDLIAYPSTAFRAAVTSWPDFLLVNFIRDQMSAFVLTEGYTPFVTGMRGVGDEIRQGTWARQYNAAMGTMGGMNSANLHDARVTRDIEALRSKGYIARVTSGKGVAGAIKSLARVTELTETGTRLGIFRQAYERAKADGLTDWEANVEASYVATDYIDFGLHGNRMMAWRRLIPFLNAQLQGLYKMMRTLGGDEVAQRRGIRFAVSAFFKDINGLELSRTERQAIRTGRKAWLKMAGLGIIGAALQAVFEDDPDYQDASEYLRTTGWVIPIGNGEIFYIPKPFELAMVSNIVERGMEAASGDKEAKWRMLRGMAMNLVPPTNPPAIQAAVEQAANWDSFSGREIVPDYMRALEPELQYNHFTSEFAKSMGKMLGWSPMRIDHAMSSFGASAYRDLTSMYNMTDPDRPSSDKTDWPITRRFVRDARRGAASAADFWKFASTVDGSLRRAELTYKNYIEAGQDGAAQSYLDGLQPDEQAYALLNVHFKADFKRLNPTYRARQMTTIISAMRRELYSNLGVENTGPGGEDDPFMMSAKEKADVDEILSEYARREVRNSLVFMKAPGWANKKPLPTEPTIELLRATQPLVADEFERRIKKAKVYDAETIQEYWPEVRDRLLTDRDEAFLKDIQTVAKVMR